MPILFSAVTGSSRILSQCASCSGNFTEVIHQILPKIPPQDQKFTFAVENSLIHYISENKLVFLCITDSKFPRPTAFKFLDEIKRKFLGTFIAVSEQDGAFERAMQDNMMQYNNKNKVSLLKIKTDVAELKNQMIKRIDDVAHRGGRLDNLMNRADGLATNTTTYRRTAVEVQRKYWWQNMRMKIVMVVVLAAVVYGGGSAACGGLKWPKCV